MDTPKVVSTSIWDNFNDPMVFFGVLLIIMVFVLFVVFLLWSYRLPKVYLVPKQSIAVP